MSKPTILVTGATGKTGGAVARELLGQATRFAPSHARQTTARRGCGPQAPT